MNCQLCTRQSLIWRGGTRTSQPYTAPPWPT
ncbi:hypothetical protein E2C01_070033 [Portunus trituberculatus]|uniref:Uncharacterized protein n=1 Tax=Portunus trituberculatus TaxID=210409 RepID=A0A5B7HT59_PORTR|nr:hypothetical protein [Portunus trituberculatus]